MSLCLPLCVTVNVFGLGVSGCGFTGRNVTVCGQVAIEYCKERSHAYSAPVDRTLVALVVAPLLLPGAVGNAAPGAASFGTVWDHICTNRHSSRLVLSRDDARLIMGEVETRPCSQGARLGVCGAAQQSRVPPRTCGTRSSAADSVVTVAVSCCRIVPPPSQRPGPSTSGRVTPLPRLCCQFCRPRHDAVVSSTRSSKLLPLVGLSTRCWSAAAETCPCGLSCLSLPSRRWLLE